MNLRRKVANLLIRIAARLDPSRPPVVNRPGGGTEVRLGDVPPCRVEPGVDLHHQGVRSTTMWTKLNSSSGNFARGGPRVPWRSRR